MRSGASGGDVVLRVPPSTQFFDAETDDLVAEIEAPGQRVLLAEDGEGGLEAGDLRCVTGVARA